MADTPWPSVEAALIDHLPTVTPIDWEAPGRSEPGARVPLGVVEQVGGIQDVGLDKQATVEVTVYAARRPGCWQLASAIDIAMLRGLIALFAFSMVARADEPKPVRALLVIGGCCHDYAKQKDILTKGLEARAHIKITIAYDPSTKTTHAKVNGSRAPMPKSRDWKSRAETREPARPMARPRPMSLEPWLTTIEAMSPRLAPMERRTPNSRVRWATP